MRHRADARKPLRHQTLKHRTMKDFIPQELSITQKSNARHKSKKVIYFLFLCLSCTLSSHAIAGYIAIGPIEAEDCYDFGISVCSKKTVTEVRQDGKRFEITRYFENVSEYNPRKGLCFIKTKSKGWGFLSWGINAATQPDFWGYDKDGKYVKIDADYIRFKCTKE